MSEFDALVEGFDGLNADEKELLAGQIQANAHRAAPETPSSMGERRPDVAEVAGSTPAGSIEEVGANGDYVSHPDEPPTEPDDWPEPPPEIPVFATDELRVLKPDQRPVVGSHYVIFDGVPRPVVRGNLTASEDEFVRENLFINDELRDIDGQRRVRADRTLRLRYRGYVCGQMSSL